MSDYDCEDEPIKKQQLPPIIMNIYDTNYSVVRYVAQNMLRWRLMCDPESPDWDVYWTDCAVSPELLTKMKSHQKVNHFPGMFILARKNNLGKQLTRMKKVFPNEFTYFPQTWTLPTELNDLREYCRFKGRDKTLIVKPEASCQGRGIFLTRSCDFGSPHERSVVQKYIEKPFLLDGLKFDFRIYVLVAGCDPLRLFIYTEGLARLSTEAYESPGVNNYHNLCMHLTNYAINKMNENFVFNEDETQMDIGHKRAMSGVFEKLKQDGYDIDTLWMSIKQIVIKTMCTAQPVLKHQYTTCQSNNLMNNMCFEILGFDIMIDHKFKPYLLEVNHSPSFSTDSPLDQYIKSNLIQDALTIMNINPEERYRIIQEKNNETKRRVMTGKILRYNAEERRIIIEQNQLIRDAYEDDNLGGFEKIYPCEEEEETQYYQQFINYAQEQFEESTGTRKPMQIQRTINQTQTRQDKSKNDDIQRIYQKASLFLQKPFNKTQQLSQQPAKKKQKPVGRPSNAEIAYKHMIKMQIQSEQRKIDQLIRRKKPEELEQRLSLSYQGQRSFKQSELNHKFRFNKYDKQ